jgi:hypothetical protein
MSTSAHKDALAATLAFNRRDHEDVEAICRPYLRTGVGQAELIANFCSLVLLISEAYTQDCGGGKTVEQFLQEYALILAAEAA